MTPGTLVTVFNKYPGVVKANGKINPPANHVRVEFKGLSGMQVSAYVSVTDVKERKKWPPLISST
jgi:hypothetical protein